MIRTIFPVLILLMLAPPSIAAAEAQPPAHVQELRARAANGDAEAQFNLGGIYFKGREVAQDYAESAKWLRLAATSGHPLAQYNLGMMYDSGQGLALNHTEAARWYRLAAEQGFSLAQLNLGVAYATAEGLPQDMTEAIKWFRLAAAQGDAQAQFDLGVIYANGQGVRQDLVEAYRWAKLSADHGNEMAKTLLNDLSKKMTREQQASGNRLAAQDQSMQNATGKDKTDEKPLAKPVAQNPVSPDAATGHDGYYLQLGAFKSERQAADFLEKMRNKLGELDKPYSLFANEGWVRIHVGPYQERNEASQDADKLKVKLGFAPKIRKH